MSRFGFYGSVVYTLLFLIATTVRSQVLSDPATTTTLFGSLPSAPAYADGAFTSPNNEATPILDNGVNLNITWTTTYSTVNLYRITGDDFGNPQALTLGTSNTYFPWKIDDSGNNTLPFLFRIVNAQGSAYDQLTGGFDSGQFWIRDDRLTSSSSTSSPSTSSSSTSSSSTSSSSTSSTSTTSSSTTSSSKSSSNTPTITTTTSSSVSPIATTSLSRTTPASMPSPGTNTAASSPISTPSPSGLSTGALAGAVIGAVAALAAIIGAALYFRRKRRASTSSQHLMEIQQMTQEGQWSDKPAYSLRDPSSVQKSPLAGPVELANYRSSRQHELE